MISTDTFPAITDSLAQALGDGGALDVLILGDPSAVTCRALSDSGHRVACCPDLQHTADSTHLNVIAEEVEALLQGSGHWDLIIAVNGFQRLRQVRRPGEMDALIAWMAEHGAVTLMEAPRLVLAPDLHDLGPYEVRELLGSFALVNEVELSHFRAIGHHPASASRTERPIIAASNHLLLVGKEWVSVRELIPLGRNDHSTTVRTFQWGQQILKVDVSSAGYFERCEALREGLFLASAKEEHVKALALPAIIEVHQGRAVSTVVRESVSGDPLHPGACREQDPPIGLVLEAAAAMARVGLFHNDLRPWNLLWDGRRVMFIDYADTSTSDSDVQYLPQILALAGTVASLMTSDVPWGDAFLGATKDLAADVHVLTRWPLEQLYETPWMTLPSALPILMEGLSSMPDPRAGEIVGFVVDTLMSRVPVEPS